jgi:hypothetical protein
VPSNLYSKEIKNTYQDLLFLSGTTDNEGLTASLKPLIDGAGNQSKLSLSQYGIGIGGKFHTNGISGFGFYAGSGSDDIFKILGGNVEMFTVQSDGVIKLRDNPTLPTTVVDGGLTISDGSLYLGDTG